MNLHFFPPQSILNKARPGHGRCAKGCRCLQREWQSQSSAAPYMTDVYRSRYGKSEVYSPLQACWLPRIALPASLPGAGAALQLIGCSILPANYPPDSANPSKFDILKGYVMYCQYISSGLIVTESPQSVGQEHKQDCESEANNKSRTPRHRPLLSVVAAPAPGCEGNSGEPCWFDGAKSVPEAWNLQKHHCQPGPQGLHHDAENEQLLKVGLNQALHVAHSDACLL